MAGRRMCNNKQAVVAVAMAAALLALLFAAGVEAGACNVDRNTVMRECVPACSHGGEPNPSKGCCDALKNADYGCLCRTYWSQIESSGYGSCAKAIPSKCNPNAPRSCPN